MPFSLGEYQDIFLEEADEQLQELNQNLLELEKNPEDIDIINNIFRAAHSLKSSAAFVGLNDLSDLAHKMENLLQGIRDRTINITAEVIDIIFKCFDEITGVINSVASGKEPKQDLSWIIEEIQVISENARIGSKSEKLDTATHSKSEPIAGIPKTIISSIDRTRIKEGLDTGYSCYELTIFIDESAQMKWVKAQLVLNNLSKLGQIVTTIPSAEDLTDDAKANIFKVIMLTDALNDDIKRACNIDLIYRVDIKGITLTKKDNKLVLQFNANETINGKDKDKDKDSDKELDNTVVINDTANIDEDSEEPDDKDDSDVYEDDIVDIRINGAHKGKQGSKETEQTDQEKRKISALKTVKVSIDKLDLLLNNVGELVIANSGFYKLYEEIRRTIQDKSISNEFKSRMEQMSRIAKDLQTGIMKTRMVPIGQIFSRFNRLVRDLSKEFSKKVELVIKGEDTELDKKVIDSIGEPLMHLIRNAIDHGIEPADERKKLGKAEIASVTLNAYQGGNQIFVEVSDDGRGLNLELIKKKALDMGMANIEMISSMDNNDIYNFIFTPGFSTATKITDISGRGVGMNVVKETVNELNGNVAIETESGMGTRFVMSFPLTLAIIPAIMTKVRKETYAIPLSDVIETIKISESDITTIEGHEVINLRGEILSLLRLSDFVGVDSALSANQKIPVVVVGYGNRKIGLIVDYLEGKLEIVIKSLEQNYTTVEGLAGASILGDGSICLILDISSMINKVISEQDKLKKVDRRRISEVSAAEVEKVADISNKKVEKDINIEKKTLKTEPLMKEVSKSKTIIEQKEKEKSTSNLLNSSSKSVKDDVKTAPLTQKYDQKSQDILISTKDKIDKHDDEPSKSRKIEKVDELIDEARTPVANAKEEYQVVDEKVHKALEDFKKELRENIATTIDSGGPSEHMAVSLDVSKDDLNEFQVLANIGAANAAESLSKIISKRIDLSIPEVTIQPIEQIPKYLGDVDNIYIGVMLPVVGDAKGTMLFILNEDVGFELIDMLYGTTTKTTKELNEDGESALQELTNIIGSSVINIFAEKTGIVIKPKLPTIVHDYMQSVIDSILIVHNMINDYAIVMDTAFYFENDKVIGNLLLLPEAESLKNIVERLRSNVGSN